MSGLIPGRLLPAKRRPGSKDAKPQPDYATILALAELDSIDSIEQLRRASGYRTREENYRGKKGANT